MESPDKIRLQRCRIAKCDRNLVRHGQGERYCRYHALAHSKIVEGFKDWVVAYGNISWERYLETILGLRETGDWAKQVAVDLASQPRASQS